jgi:hypothetical protein
MRGGNREYHFAARVVVQQTWLDGIVPVQTNVGVLPRFTGNPKAKYGDINPHSRTAVSIFIHQKPEFLKTPFRLLFDGARV